MLGECHLGYCLSKNGESLTWISTWNSGLAQLRRILMKILTVCTCCLRYICFIALEVNMLLCSHLYKWRWSLCPTVARGERGEIPGSEMRSLDVGCWPGEPEGRAFPLDPRETATWWKYRVKCIICKRKCREIHNLTPDSLVSWRSRGMHKCKILL